MLNVLRENKFLNRKIRWISILLIILLCIAFAVTSYIYYQIEPVVAARFKETIKTSTNGLYDISFSRLSINPFTGNVTIKDIVFKANTEVYTRLKRERIRPNHIYEVRVQTIRLKRVHPLKVYLKKDLVINTVLIENPRVRVFYEKTIEKDSSKVDTRTPWQKLSKYLHSIKIEKVLFKNIDFKYIDQRLAKPEINGIKNLSITIKDILIDSLSHRDTSRLYSTKDILVEVFDNEFESNDAMYTIGFDKLEMSTQNRYAMFSGLKVLPKYSEIDFSLRWPIKKARYNLGVSEIWLKGIDYKNLMDNRKLHASALEIFSGSLEVFMNKQQPKAKGDLGENFPQLMLKKLRLTSTIDTIKVTGSKLSYSEYDPHTAKTGRISFLALSGEALNVTNDSVSLKKNHWTTCSFTGFAYGKGRIDLNINFNLTSASQQYNYHGKLHQMQARYFNQITRPLALLDISAGEAKSATFSVSADYRNAKGSMTIIYNDLNIGILKLNKNKRLQRSTILSLVANNLLLKEDNPSKGEPLRIGRIAYSRPDSISFYSMIWNTLFSGIKENIGMTPEREKQLQETFRSFKSQSPEKSRVQRKLEREERRRRRNKK